jgi:hypothetical protein
VWTHNLAIAGLAAHLEARLVQQPETMKSAAR